MTVHPGALLTTSRVRNAAPARVGATCPPGLARLLGAGSLGLVVTAGAAALLVRAAAPGALVAAGPWLLLAAAVVGLPHGALDTALLDERPQALPRPSAAVGYLAVAAAVFALWWRFPGPAVALLLVVSAAHFAVSDLGVARWRRSRAASGAQARVAAGLEATAVAAAASGVLAVAAPFAWWPARTTALLGRLDAAGAAPGIDGAARVLVVIALVAAGGAGVALWRRDPVTALEPFVVAVLLWACPPLVGFAVYFAFWHATRQSARLLALHPQAARELRRHGTRAAVVLIARQAAVPTLGALVLLVVLVLAAPTASAGVLAALLAISVPHGAVTAWREHVLAAAPEAS